MQKKDMLVIVGMSGGVDSAVAAKLLIEQGYRVEGLFMKNWNETDDVAYCTAQQDLEDALQVCNELDITLHQVNFSQQYWDRVFHYFLQEYKAGRTPNPDIMCNKEIKFDAFLKYSLKLGADKIATGHYSQIRQLDNHWQLLKSKDTEKDQSYFLYRLGQKELSHSIFPLGEIQKSQVRTIAETAGFDNHKKKDSTGICFIGERRFRDFLARYLPSQKGKIITDSGEIIGEHNGAFYYTIGQRQGLGIGGIRTSDHQPWYVVDKNVKANTLTVIQGNNHPSLYKKYITANQLHWVREKPYQLPLDCYAKIRYRQQDQACTIKSIENDGTIEVFFTNAQRAITPGQSIVFYQKTECLGGGIINHAYN